MLADNFFQGAFGGSFLNHSGWSAPARRNIPMPTRARPRELIAAVEADGVTLTLADNSPKSAMDGIPKFVNNGQITPDFYAINTMQPPYQPSDNKPAAGRRPALRRSEQAEHAAAAA